MYNWPHQNTLLLPPPQLSVEATNSHTQIHTHTQTTKTKHRKKSNGARSALSTTRVDRISFVLSLFRVILVIFYYRYCQNNEDSPSGPPLKTFLSFSLLLCFNPLLCFSENRNRKKKPLRSTRLVTPPRFAAVCSPF